jgi:colanic acid biosynthesis protein WcaH
MIETDLYNKIIDVLPIICVDGFIFNDNNEVLLLKRLQYPAMNEWWVPGGRVLKNEKLINAINRKIKEEINLEFEIVNQCGITETIFDKKHTINICYLLKLIGNNIPEINYSEHSEYGWFNLNNLPSELNIHIKEMIEKHDNI